MESLLSVARMAVIFVAASGFLFGQLFFGRFEYLDTIAGLSGVLAGLCTFFQSAGRKAIHYATIGVAIVSGLGAGAHAVEYYTARSPTTGSYYPWFMIGPYLAGLLVLIFYTTQKLRRTVSGDNPE